MSNNATLKQNQPKYRGQALRKRIKKASKAAETIKKDLQRDCIPYWKLDALAEELLDIAESLKTCIDCRAVVK